MKLCAHKVSITSLIKDIDTSPPSFVKNLRFVPHEESLHDAPQHKADDHEPRYWAQG